MYSKGLPANGKINYPKMAGKGDEFVASHKRKLFYNDMMQVFFY